MSSQAASVIISANEQQTLDAGRNLCGRLLTDHPDGFVVLLIGPLGAGKTVLAKGIALGLGIAEPIVSPTYTIVSEYTSGSMPLSHIDLYRIEGTDQMENLGLDDMLRGNGLVVVEWGEKLESILASSLTAPYLRVSVSLNGDGGRTITVEEVGA